MGLDEITCVHYLQFSKIPILFHLSLQVSVILAHMPGISLFQIPFFFASGFCNSFPSASQSSSLGP